MGILKACLFDQNHCKIVPAAVGFFLRVNFKAVISSRSENIDAASFHHGPDAAFSFFRCLRIARTSVLSGRSGCSGLGLSARPRWKRGQRKRFIIAHFVCFTFQPNGGIRQGLSFWAVQEDRSGVFPQHLPGFFHTGRQWGMVAVFVVEGASVQALPSDPFLNDNRLRIDDFCPTAPQCICFLHNRFQ